MAATMALQVVLLDFECQHDTVPIAAIPAWRLLYRLPETQCSISDSI